MASNSGVATLRNFCWVGSPQKCLLGNLPKPGCLGQNTPKRLAALPPLSHRFLNLFDGISRHKKTADKNLLSLLNSKQFNCLITKWKF